MGLFDQLFGASSKVKETGTTSATTSGTQTQTGTATQTNNTTQNQTQTGVTNANTTQNQNTTNTGVVSTLDDASKAALQSLLGPLLQNASEGAAGGSNENADALKAIAEQFLGKAGTESDLVSGATDAAVNKAKLDFQTGEGAQVKSVAQQIGSTGNTYSQLLSDKANNDLLTQIAAITTQGQLSASALQSDDLKNAISALVSGSSVGGQDASTTLNPLLQVLSLLKGADTTTTQEQATTGQSQTGQISSEQSVSDQIAQIIGNTTSNTTENDVKNIATSGVKKGNSSNGIINDLLAIF